MNNDLLKILFFHISMFFLFKSRLNYFEVFNILKKKFEGKKWLEERGI